MRLIPTPPLPPFGTAVNMTEHVSLESAKTGAFGFVWNFILHAVLGAVYWPLKRLTGKNKIHKTLKK